MHFNIFLNVLQKIICCNTVNFKKKFEKTISVILAVWTDLIQSLKLQKVFICSVLAC